MADLSFGSLLETMIWRSFQRVDGRAGSEGRYYTECRYCEGNDAGRPRLNRPSLTLVEHRDGCLLAKHLPRLKAMANEGRDMTADIDRMDKAALIAALREARAAYISAAEAAHIMRDHAERAEAEAARMRDVVEAIMPHLLIAEHDWPGDAPELCGYSCLICHGFGPKTNEIEHRDGCALAALEPTP